MENNIQRQRTSSFPIACILFFIGSALFFVYSIINSIATPKPIGTAAGGVALGSVLIICAPFFLLAFASTNTSKKPTVFFLIVMSIQGFISSIGFIGTLIICIQNFQYNIVLGLINIISVIAAVISTIGYFSVFAFSLIAKISKKPSKLCKLWPLFPSVLALGFLTNFAGRAANFIFMLTEAFAFGTYHILSLIAVLLYLLTNIILTGAFFGVCYQFAKVNKNLPLRECK